MCTERYINLFTDFGFKRAFGTAANKEYLISFLNSVIVDGDPIVDITYRNVEHKGFISTVRGVVYDLYCTTESGTHIIVEMQNVKQTYFIDRSIYYSTYPIMEEAQKGSWDFNLPRIYTIAFMNFTMPVFSSDPGYMHTVMLTDVDTKRVISDKLTYIYLELPKYQVAIEDIDSDDILGIWMFLVKNMHKLDAMPENIKHRIFRKFFEMAEIAAFTKDERFAYEQSLKDMRDYDNGLATAKEEGIVIGKAEGAKSKAIEIAHTLLSHGMSPADVTRITGLTETDWQ